ncbi:42154_t:CDS:2, partial [Gigaspora margarita]
TLEIIEKLQEARVEALLLYKAKLDTHRSGKLEEKWKGPYYIHEVYGNSSYQLRTFDDKVLLKSVHGNLLKKYHEQ